MGIKSLTSSSSNKFNKVVLVSAIGLALGLSACGGGGGGSAAVPAETVTGATIGGIASKGIVKSGVVTAEELNTSGDVIATVGNATTAADGSYSLTLNNNYTGGPIQISITANSDTQTKCDAPAGCGTRTDGLTDTDSNIGFGEWYKPVALTMTALVPGAEANETLSVSVTPFTHMAAARAKESATLDATAVANANSEVSNLLGGIDILNTPPVDITDSVAVNDALSETQVTYAALASALSNQGLVDINGQPDLNAAIDLLASSFTSGIIEADDSDGDDAAQISLQEIIDAAAETFAEAGITDVTGVLVDLQSDITTAEAGDGTINPEPSDTIADPNLDKVKAMMSDVRTWGNVIVAETEARATAFETQVSLASDAIGVFGGADPIDVLDASINAAFDFINGTGSTDIASYNLGLNPFVSGTINSTTPGVITISNAGVYGYTANVIINMPEDGTTASSFTLGIVSATIANPNNNLTINNGLANVTFATDYTVDYAAIDLGTNVLPKATDLTFNLDNVAFTQNVDSLGAALASPVSFSGTLSFDLDMIPVTNNPLDDMALPKTFNLSGVLSNTLGDSLTATLAGNVTNTATFQFVGDAYPVGTLYSALHSGGSMIQWAYTDTDATAGNDTFTYTSPYNNQSLYWSATNTSITNWSSFTNHYTNLSDLVVNSYIVSDNYYYVAGEGQYYFSTAGVDVTVDGFMDGVLEFSEDPGSYPDGISFSQNHTPEFYWTYTDTDAIAGNDTFTYTRPDGSQSYYWNAADNSITQSNTYTYPTYEASLAEAITNNIYPYDAYISIDGEGSYIASVVGADFSVDGQVVGALVEPEYIEEQDTANGWIDADIGLTFIAQLAGLPEASINITADRTGFEAGDGEMTISYGDRQLTLSASLSNSALDGELTITNQDNVVLAFEDTDINVDGPSLSGSLSYNGVVYGTVKETSNGLVKTTYIDGTFEIF